MCEVNIILIKDFNERRKNSITLKDALIDIRTSSNPGDEYIKRAITSLSNICNNSDTKLSHN